MISPPIDDPKVALAFGALPDLMRERIYFLRHLIFDEAQKIDGINAVTESLKWGQPSYLAIPKIGTPLRLGREKKTPDNFGLYVHCHTNLIETFKHIYPDHFTYGGNRSILFKLGDDIDQAALRHCISMALTYRKKSSSGPIG